MTIYSSTQSKAFYSDEVSFLIPPDAEAITDELHQYLLKGQSDGKLIDFSEHPPRLVERSIIWPGATELSRFIDDRIAAVYAVFARFEPEYRAREKAAAQYLQTGEEQKVGGWVSRYAEAAGLALQPAAEAILAKALQRETALESLADARLRKHELAGLEGEARNALYREVIEQVEQIETLFTSIDNLPVSLEQTAPTASAD